MRSHRDRIWSTTVVRHSSSSVTTAGRPQDRLMLLMFCFCFLFLRCIFPPSRVGASGVFWSAEREDRSASFSCLFGFVSFSFRFVLFFSLLFFPRLFLSRSKSRVLVYFVVANGGRGRCVRFWLGTIVMETTSRRISCI